MKTVFSLTRDPNGHVCYVDQYRCLINCDNCSLRFKCYTTEKFIIDDVDLLCGDLTIREHLRRLFGEEYDDIILIATKNEQDKIGGINARGNGRGYSLIP